MQQTTNPEVVRGKKQISKMSRIYKVGEGSNEMEVIETGGRMNGAPGYTIASIIGVIFILAVLFWVFDRSNRNHHESNYRTSDHNCQTRERLGILEGEMHSVNTVLGQLVPKVSSLAEFTSAQIGGLVEFTKCTEKEFGHVYGSIGSLDRAVFTSRCGGDNRFGGCGEGRGGSRFALNSTFTQVEPSSVTFTDNCRN